MKALTRRVANALNELMRRSGPVFEDRYHAHVLRTPREVANALAYVLANYSSHAKRRGERITPTFEDEYSSAAAAGPDGAPPPVSCPRSWLMVQLTLERQRRVCLQSGRDGRDGPRERVARRGDPGRAS